MHLAWFDIERMGWEEGDVICGLVVVGDETVATGMMRVTCDAEGDGGGRSEEEEVEIVDAVRPRAGADHAVMRLVRLRAPGGELEAAFAPEAGLVGSSLTHRGEELLRSAGRSRSTRAAAPPSGSRSCTRGPIGWRTSATRSPARRSSSTATRRCCGSRSTTCRSTASRRTACSWEVEERGDALRAETEFDRERLEAFPYPHRLAWRSRSPTPR